MKKNVLFLMCLLLLAGVTQAELYQWLDASKADSVIVDTPVYDTVDPNIVIGYAVSRWIDQSGNGRDATADLGAVAFPSTVKSSSGLAGLDFGDAANTLAGLTAAEANYLWDYSATTPGNPDTGFSILVSVITFGVGTDQYILGTKNTLDNFALEVQTSGVFNYRFDTQNNDDNFAAVEGGSYVLGVTFDPTLGSNNFEFWYNGESGVKTQGQKNLNSAGNEFRIGRARNDTGSPFLGVIGEIRLWDERLPEAEFAYQVELMNRKWVDSRAVSPLDGAGAIASANVGLVWENLLSETQGEDVYADVWFGTEPNRLTMTQVVIDGLNATTTTVNASTVGQTYYWAVDNSFGSPANPADPNVITIEGPYYSFDAVADPAPESIDAGPDYSTWPGEGVPVSVGVLDGGSANITVTFTADDPNVVFSPNPVTISGGGVPKSVVTAETTATIDYDASVDVTVTATAEDAENPGETVSDTMSIRVFGSACQAARIGLDLAGDNPEDLYLAEPSGCVIDLYDLAAVLGKWLDSYAATSAFLDPDQPAAPLVP